MKQILILFVSFFMIQATIAKADNDKVITFEQLPAAAQEFVKNYFLNQELILVNVEKSVLCAQYEETFKN